MSRVDRLLKVDMVVVRVLVVALLGLALQCTHVHALTAPKYCKNQCPSLDWEFLSPAANATFCFCVYPVLLHLKLLNSSSSEKYLTAMYFPKELADQLSLKPSQVILRGWTKEDGGATVKTSVWLLSWTTKKFPPSFLERIQRLLQNKKIFLSKEKYGGYKFLDITQLEPPSPPPPNPPSPSPPPSPPSLQPPSSGSGNGAGGGQGASQIKKSGGGSKSFLIIVVGAVLAVLFLLLLICVWLCLHSRNRRRIARDSLESSKKPLTYQEVQSFSGQSGHGSRGQDRGRPLNGAGPGFDGSSLPRPMSVRVFSYEELVESTNNFAADTLLGEGGFGRVYRGTLRGGMEVAIKKLTSGGHQGDREFLVEVEMLSKLHHRHLVKLLGYYSSYAHQLLCYELVPNGSLESWLHGSLADQAVLDWPTRMKIAIGSARGLAYLHEDAQPCVIHRDFKSSNILLEMNFQAKVADFGLAKPAPEGPDDYVSTRVMGTFGYVAPEYAMTGHLVVKSDVYSYGVVLLELLSGRKPVDMTQPAGQENLVTWARPRLNDEARHHELLDPQLDLTSVPLSDLRQVAAIAAACVSQEASQRPTMGEVVQSLKLVQHEQEYNSTTGDVSGLSPNLVLVDDVESTNHDESLSEVSSHNGVVSHRRQQTDSCSSPKSVGSFASDSGPLFRNQTSSAHLGNSGFFGKVMSEDLSEGR